MANSQIHPDLLDRADEIIDVLYKILDKIEGQKSLEKAAPVQGLSTPLDSRPRTKRYPLRVDAGTIFRSRAGYNWTCPYCLKPIQEGDMIVAFAPKEGARTTYAHLSCDEEEQAFFAND